MDEIYRCANCYFVALAVYIEICQTFNQLQVYCTEETYVYIYNNRKAKTFFLQKR